jgi:hypothetical protein
MIKLSTTVAVLALSFTCTPVVAQDVGAYLNQCLEAVTTRDPAVFGEQKALVAIGETGDEDIRRIYILDGETTGVSEMSFALGMVYYEPVPRLGADCSVTMILDKPATEAAATFRESFASQFGPIVARERNANSAEVDEFACLPSGLPLRLIMRMEETSIRVSIWDSLPDRPGC